MAKSPTKKLMRKLIPALEIAGLEITDSTVRLLMLSREELKVLDYTEVGLPVNTVVRGEVKSIANLTRALLEIRRKAPYFAKNPLAVLILPSSSFFLHIISLPELSKEEEYSEAVRLNMQQFSPIKLEEAYLDWQHVGVNLKTLEREILVGLGAKAKMNPYIASLRQAGIEPVAIEPNSLGLLRLINTYAPVFEKGLAQLIINISTDGLNLLIGQEGRPLFDEYRYWRDFPEAADGQVTREDFEEIIEREVRRVIDYYSAHFNEEIKHGVLMAPFLKNELAKILTENFHLHLIGLRFPLAGGEPLPDVWSVALGAAVRGTVPRSADTMVSLMLPGTEVAYAHKRLIAFVSLWGKIFSVTLFGLVAGLALLVSIVSRIEKTLSNSYVELRGAPPSQEIMHLTDEAKVFNQLVQSASQVETQSVRWSGFFGPLVLAANEITFDRVSLSQPDAEIRILAHSGTREAALAFKKKLEDSKVYTKVDLPIASFSALQGGVSFSMTLGLPPLTAAK